MAKEESLLHLHNGQMSYQFGPVSNLKFKSKRNDTSVHEAFRKLKEALCTAPVLAYPDFSKEFYIHCDASNVALGAVISKMHGNRLCPIMFCCRHLAGAETRNSATERELLAIVWASKKFNPYIYGRHSMFITDHQPLVTMKNLREPLGRIGNLFVKLQDLDYTLVYQPGASNYTADFLSRIEANLVDVSFQPTVN